MAIFAMASAVAGFVKVRFLVDKAIIDNMVFRMHYRITCAILFLCCILVTANNLIGDPISCINDGGVPTHVINTFCWITYTFTLPGTSAAHHGHPGLGNDRGVDNKIVHAYYQWVPFMLFFQGILFYLPHWIWKNLEEGKIRMISDGMRGTMIMHGEEIKSRQERLVRYLLESKLTHNTYSFAYFFCEMLNFINSVGNIFFIDLFLGGAFMTYGTDVVRFSNLNQEDRTDPMIEIFPRITKCTFHKFGASGTIQAHDALCVLALNILNEKIYIFLWFWLIILSIMSGLALVYSAVIVLMPTMRQTILKKRFKVSGIEKYIEKTQIGDYFILHLLGQNLCVSLMSDVLGDMSRHLQNGSNPPSAPSTIEMAPIYPDPDKYLTKEDYLSKDE